MPALLLLFQTGVYQGGEGVGTFVYSRTYLPEFVSCRAHELEKVYNNAKAADKTHFTAMYDSQVARIQSVREWIARTPICDNSIFLYWCDGDEGYTDEKNCGYSLIDGDPSTYWWSSKDSRTLYDEDTYEDYSPSAVGSHTVSWVEFHTFFSNVPKSFTITCGKKNNIPKYFQLIAKKDKNDKWESIYYGRINDKLESKTGATLTLDIQKPGNYNYYRIECSGNPIGYSLAEFKLNYE